MRGWAWLRVVLVAAVLVGTWVAPAGAQAGPKASGDVTFIGGRTDPTWTSYLFDYRDGYLPIVGNFNEDRLSDIFWYGPGGLPDEIWFGTTRTERFSKRPVSLVGSYRPVVGDFAGSPSDDILWYCPGTCPDLLWVANGLRSVFSVRSVRIDGTYRVPSVTGTSYTTRPTGGIVLRDGSSGKDDILWYGPGRAPDAYWHFDDQGSGSHKVVPQTINADAVAVVGNFSGRDRTDDVIFYGPGSRADSLWTSDGRGGFSKRTVSVNGLYTPATLRRKAPGDADAVLWYAGTTCGPGSVLWRFKVGGTYTVRKAFPSQYFPSKSCPTANDYPATFEGGDSLLVHSNTGSDFQVWDDASGVSWDYLDRISRGSGGVAHVSGSVILATGDFNGDRQGDVLWYRVPTRSTGRSTQQIWFGGPRVPGSCNAQPCS